MAAPGIIIVSASLPVSLAQELACFAVVGPEALGQR